MVLVAYITAAIVGNTLDAPTGEARTIRGILISRRLRKVVRAYRSAHPAIRALLIVIAGFPIAMGLGIVSMLFTGSMALGVAIGIGILTIDQIQATLRRRQGWLSALGDELDDVWPRGSEERALFRKLANFVWCGTPGWDESGARDAFHKTYQAITKLRETNLSRRQREHIDLILLTAHAAFADKDKLEESRQRVEAMEPRRATVEALLAATDEAYDEQTSAALAFAYLDHRERAR